MHPNSTRENRHRAVYAIREDQLREGARTVDSEVSDVAESHDEESAVAERCGRIGCNADCVNSETSIG